MLLPRLAIRNWCVLTVLRHPSYCVSNPLQTITGQIVIKKTGNHGLNLAALHIAAHMQVEHPFYFKLSDGDKDTFVSSPYQSLLALMLTIRR